MEYSTTTFNSFKPLTKGEQTRAAIIQQALQMASREGLESLTIGAIAESLNKSKSGVFAHFGSREELQLCVIQSYHDLFRQAVFDPAMRVTRGVSRVRALFENWLQQVTIELTQGCIYISGAVEYDDRPGVVRSALLASISDWREALIRATQQAVDVGDFYVDTDVQQFVFEVWGLILVVHHDARLLKSPMSLEQARRGFERLLACYLR